MMKKRTAKKRSKRDAEILQGMYDFTRDLAERLAGLYQEVEEYHQLKEHLLIVLGTKKRRFTIEHDDAELRFIYGELDKQLFPKKDAD